MSDKFLGLKFFQDYREEIKKSLNDKDIKVIYTDCDGTLLNDKGSVINDSEGKYFFGALECLELLDRKGIDLVMVSGRNKLQLKYNAQMVNLKNYIAELGSEVVYDTGRKVYMTYDKKNYKYNFASLNEDFERVIKLLKNNFPGKIECKIDWNKNRHTNILLLGEIDIDTANKLLQENGFDDYILINNGTTSLYQVELNTKKTYFYNLMPKGIDKSTGVKFDKKHRNFKKENCLALGDSKEDIKMASEVEYFFLMNNDIDDEKDLIKVLRNCDNVYITDGKMNRGFTEVIKYLFT